MKLSYSFRVINLLILFSTLPNIENIHQYLVGKNIDEKILGNTCFYAVSMCEKKFSKNLNKKKYVPPTI